MCSPRRFSFGVRDGQAVTPLPTDDSTEGPVFCISFTLTRSRGQAAAAELSC